MKRKRQTDTVPVTTTKIVASLQAEGKKLATLTAQRHSFFAGDEPGITCALLNAAFGSYDGHVIWIPDGEFKWTDEGLWEVWSSESKSKSKDWKAQARRIVQRQSSSYQLLSPWFVDEEQKKPTIKARAVCLESQDEWLINADMLVSSFNVKLGRSLFSSRQRRQLLPDWLQVFAPTDARAHKKMKQADERAAAFTDHLPDNGYILILGGLLSETVRHLLGKVDTDRVIIADFNVKQLVWHFGTKMLLGANFHLLMCDLNDLLSPKCSAKMAPGLPPNFRDNITAMYADFCGAIHPKFQGWIKSMPNLATLAVTQAYRSGGKEWPDEFGNLVEKFRCVEVECRLYRK